MPTHPSITAVRDGQAWRWRWTAPWATAHDGPTLHKSRAAAIAAGNRWLAGERR